MLTFGVQIPEAGSATRLMDDPAITSLNLLVFDQNGYLVETATASVGGSASWSDRATPTDASKTQPFTVTLTKTSAPRTIHFVANVADQVEDISFGHEDAIVPSLVSTGTDDAYWQRMEFANGIANDSGTYLSNSTVVPLIRNFAKVTVTESLSNFELEGFVVMNTRSEGAVAAYNARSAEFAQFVDGTTIRSYSAIKNEYSGYESGEQQNATPVDADFTTAAKYVRETAAGATDGTNPYIIVKGKYNGSNTSTYYRLDFVNVGGATGLGALLRNFSYNFTITGVAKAGMSLDDAIAATEGENNLSFQESTQSLLNISDGTSQLFVSATNVTLVSNEPYVLMYKYVPTIGGATANNDAKYTRQDSYDTDRSAFEESGYVTAFGTVASLIAATTDASLKAYYQEFSDYNYITLQPRLPQGNALKDVIVIEGGELAREVRFTLQQKMTMTVKAYDGFSKDKNDTKIPAATNQKVWVDITIPSTLSEYIFPLEFEIEAEALSIYPDAKPTTTVTTAERNNMPVRTGATIVRDGDGNLKSGNTFRFVRTLSLEEYNALKAAAGTNAETVTFTSQFRTNKADNKTAVHVANHYFNTGKGSFTNGGTAITEEKRIITVAFDDPASYYGAGREVTATITVPSAANTDVTVTVGDGFTQSGTSTMKTNGSGYITLNLTTAGWSGNRSVTVSYDAEIISDNQVITYTDGSATATVNKLYIPAGKIAYTNNTISGIEEFTLYHSGSSTNQTSDISNKSNETAFTVTINNLDQNSKVFYVRTDRIGGYGTDRYYSPLFSAQEALNGFSGAFTTKDPWNN